MSIQDGQLAMMHDNLYYWKDSEDATLKLINEGVTDFTQSLSPNTEDKQYIADKNARTTMTGYNPSFAYTAEMVKADPFCKRLYYIGKNQLIGVREDIVEVDSWEDATDGKVPARQYTFEVQPGNAGSGSGGSSLGMDGTLQQVGDVIQGSFDVATKEFTPTA